MFQNEYARQLKSKSSRDREASVCALDALRAEGQEAIEAAKKDSALAIEKQTQS